MRNAARSLPDAIARIPAIAEAHEMRDPAEIAHALDQLAQTASAVTVYPQGEDPLMATIADVDHASHAFVLALAGHIMAAPGRVVLVAALGGSARIQFELETTWAAPADAPHRVPLPFPTACRVLNRRAEPRLDTPVGGNYGARFALYGKVFELPLHDFSGTGVGLRATPEQAAELAVGRKLEGVQLDLGASLRVTADLEIRLLRPFRTFLLGPQVQVGCRISNITMQMRQSLDQAVAGIRRRK